MSKETKTIYDEALKRIMMFIDGISDTLSVDVGEQLEKDCEIIHEALLEAKKQLETPTSDELCEAINKFYMSVLPHLKEQRVEYKKDKKRFISYIDNKNEFGTWICSVNEMTKRLIFSQMLPPYLITLIGRFYEKELEK